MASPTRPEPTSEEFLALILLGPLVYVVRWMRRSAIAGRLDQLFEEMCRGPTLSAQRCPADSRAGQAGPVTAPVGSWRAPWIERLAAAARVAAAAR